MLRATGRYDDTTSSLMAQWAHAFYDTMSARSGLSVEQLWTRWPLRVTSATQQQIESTTDKDGSANDNAPSILSQSAPGRSSDSGESTPAPTSAPASERSDRSALGLFSALRRAVQQVPAQQASPQAWAQTIQGLINKGTIKSDEVFWSGVLDWLDLQQGKVRREDLAGFLESSGVRTEQTVLSDELARALPDGWRVQEFQGPNLGDERFVVYGKDGEIAGNGATYEEAIDSVIDEDAYADDPRSPRYADHVLAGGARYREVLLTLPEKKPSVSTVGWTATLLRPKSPVTAKPEFEIRDQDGNVVSVIRTADDSRRAINLAASLAYENKRRLANYQSKHWNVVNVLAHIRLNDRTDAQGNKVLLVQEIQSDWGQDGKKFGFAGNVDVQRTLLEDLRARHRQLDALVEGPWSDIQASGRSILNLRDERTQVARELVELQTRLDSATIPAAPFVATRKFAVFKDGRELVTTNKDGKEVRHRYNSLQAAAAAAAQHGGQAQDLGMQANTEGWLNLALKRIMVMAADEGYDRVAFVNGQQLTDRFDLSKTINTIELRPLKDGSGKLCVYTDGVLLQHCTPDALGNFIGKELAQRALVDGVQDQVVHYSGLDLIVGGHGMKAFYDEIVPAALKSLLKKLDVGHLADVWLPARDRQLRVNQIVAPAGSGRWHDFVIYDDASRLYFCGDTWSPGPSRAQTWPEKEQAQAKANELHAQEVTPSRQMGFEVTPAMRQTIAQGLPLFQRQDAAAAPRGTFDPRTLEIALGPKADASTWIHEAGHFFLEVLADLASQPNAPASIVYDFDTVLSWFDVTREEWSRFTLDEKRPYHERWAQAAEQYVMEGRAPSEELRPVMAVFATWLNAVYGSTREFLESVARSVKEWVRPTSRPEFKRWFGCSKVVDAQGEPLVVYHGTAEEFTVFDYSRIGSRGRSEGAGFYFTNSHDVASGYGSPMQVYLSIQKPLAYDAGPFSKAVIEKIVRRVAELEAKATASDIADGFLSTFGDIRSEGLETVVRSAAILIAADATALDQLSGIVGSGVSPQHVNEALRDVTGFDGVVANGFSNEGGGDNRIFVALFPEQIKSAIGNDGSFDRDDPNILSQAQLRPTPRADLHLTDDIRRVMDRMLSMQPYADRDSSSPAMVLSEQALDDNDETVDPRSMRMRA
jgi:hypothetical protein